MRMQSFPSGQECRNVSTRLVSKFWRGENGRKSCIISVCFGVSGALLGAVMGNIAGATRKAASELCHGAISSEEQLHIYAPLPSAFPQKSKFNDTISSAAAYMLPH